MPLLPWQAYVADVAGERRPDGSYEHQVVVVTVPRQAGKTTMLHAVAAHRCLLNRRDVFYTAQTGKDAGERWDDAVKLLRGSPALSGRVRVLRGAGNKRITFAGGGDYRVFAPTAESLHGYTPPTVMLDEAFAHSDIEGELLMGAIGPAQITLVDRQLWIVSTAGTAQSVFLRSWIDKALAGEPRTALFVWGAGDDLDPFNPADVEQYHPAVGQTINGKQLTAADIVAQHSRSSAAEYVRAYGNVWTVTSSNLVPAEAWAKLAHTAVAAPDTRELVLAYDVAHDGQSASVIAVWRVDGRPHGMVVLHQPGAAWLTDAVAQLRDQWRPAAIGAADSGLTRGITDELRRRDVDVRTLGERDWSTASGDLLRRIPDRRLSHDGSDELAASIAGVVTRPSSDGVAISRRHSTGDTSAAVALTAGVWVLEHEPPAVEPRVRTAADAIRAS